MDQYRFHLRQFAVYLTWIGLAVLASLSPNVLSGFVADYSPRLAWPAAERQLEHFLRSCREIVRKKLRFGRFLCPCVTAIPVYVRPDERPGCFSHARSSFVEQPEPHQAGYEDNRFERS